MNKEHYGVIYKIVNNINKKVYIGQTTKGFRRRYNISKDKELAYGLYLYHEKHDIDKDYHCNKHLLNSMRKYGWQNFTIYEEVDSVLIHKYSSKELDFKEKFWINYYNSTNPKFGYNKDLGGKGGSRINDQCFKVVCLNNGKIFESLALASEYANTDYNSVAECCRNYLKYAGKCENKEKAVWCFYEDYMLMTQEEIKNKIDKSESTRKNKTNNRKVICLNNNLIFDSLRKCANYFGISHGRISECCKGDREFIIIDDIPYKFKYYADPSAIICITTNKIFKTAIEGAKFYGIDSSSISKCCRGKLKSCGKLENGTRLVWMYYEDFLKIFIDK